MEERSLVFLNGAVRHTPSDRSKDREVACGHEDACLKSQSHVTRSEAHDPLDLSSDVIQQRVDHQSFKKTNSEPCLLSTICVDLPCLYSSAQVAMARALRRRLQPKRHEFRGCCFPFRSPFTLGHMNYVLTYRALAVSKRWETSVLTSSTCRTRYQQTCGMVGVLTPVLVIVAKVHLLPPSGRAHTDAFLCPLPSTRATR